MLIHKYVELETIIDDGQSIDPGVFVAYTESRGQFDQLLKTLTPREAEVIRLRVPPDGSQGHTLEQIGAMFGVTRERIRQIQVRAGSKIRHPARAWMLRDFHESQPLVPSNPVTCYRRSLKKVSSIVDESSLNQSSLRRSRNSIFPEIRDIDPATEVTPEFESALAILNSGRSAFITGKAGTGKSTLLKHFIATSQRRTVVAAPTGLAAINVSGVTIHRLFSFKPWMTLTDIKSPKYRPRFQDVIAQLEVLIIDEASMLRADTVDMISEALMRYGPYPGQPFGGVQIVLIGDLYQLPPVVTDEDEKQFYSQYSTPYFFSAKALRSFNLAIIELSKVFRQGDDAAFISVLNSIREGFYTSQTKNLLQNSVALGTRLPTSDDSYLIVAPMRKTVKRYNLGKLKSLDTEEFSWHARIWGDITAKDVIAEKVLRLKVGAPVLFINNDLNGQWVNGTRGRVIEIMAEQNLITVETEDNRTVHVNRHSWEKVSPVALGSTIEYEVIGTFTQFPLILGWALTIHKCQGMTLDRVIVDLANGAFATGQTYVALSRCRTIEGLLLRRAINESDIMVDNRISNWLNQAKYRSGHLPDSTIEHSAAA